MGCQPDQPSQENSEEHRDDLGDVRRQQIGQELADIGEDAASFFDCGDDRCEIVVRQHHVRSLLRHVRAGNPHSDSNVGRLERRCVVDPIARHGHDIAAAPQRLNDPELVLRSHPRIDRCRQDQRIQIPVRCRADLTAGRNRKVRADAQFGGDSARGRRMVASDHDWPNASAMGGGDGQLRFFSRRVHDPDQPKKDQILFKVTASLDIDRCIGSPG